MTEIHKPRDTVQNDPLTTRNIVLTIRLFPQEFHDFTFLFSYSKT